MVIIFDLDNTLVECSKYYVDANNQFADYTHERLGVDKNVALKILKELDLACTQLEHGFSKHRFPRSFAAASAAMDIICGHRVNEQAAEECYLLGEGVFSADYTPYEGVHETLQKYKEAGARMILYTKGDDIIQRSKIAKNNFYEYFDVGSIYVVGKKTVEGLQHIIDTNNIEIESEDVVLVGDSLRDDIGPGNVLGLTTVWCKGTFASGWAYENQDHQPTYIIDTVKDLPTVLPVTLTALPW